MIFRIRFELCIVSLLSSMAFFSSAEAQGDAEVSEFNLARAMLVLEMGKRYTSAESRIVSTYQEYLDDERTAISGRRIIERMEQSRVAALKVVEQANSNIEAALAEAQEVAAHNQPYDEVSAFLGRATQLYTIYQNANALADAWTEENGGQFSLDKYLADVSRGNELASPPDVDSDTLPASSEVDQAPNSLFDLSARIHADIVSDFEGMDANQINVLEEIEQMLDDVEWLEQNSFPVGEPALELSEGERRISRSLSILDRMDGLGPTYAESFQEKMNFVTFGSSKELLGKLPRSLPTKGFSRGKTVLEILLRPTATGEQTQFSANYRAVYREKIMDILPNYVLWRTGKPLFDYRDLIEDPADTVLKRLECHSGCVSEVK